MTRLWMVILIDGWKLLDEIMVFRAYKNAINYVLVKLHFTTLNCPQNRKDILQFSVDGRLFQHSGQRLETTRPAGINCVLPHRLLNDL